VKSDGHFLVMGGYAAMCGPCFGFAAQSSTGDLCPRAAISRRRGSARSVAMAMDEKDARLRDLNAVVVLAIFAGVARRCRSPCWHSREKLMLDYDPSPNREGKARSRSDSHRRVVVKGSVTVSRATWK